MIHRFTYLILLIFVSTFLWGCPYESAYGIDEAAQQNIDENLLGSWVAMVVKPSDDTHYKEEQVKIIFSKNTDKEYNVAIMGNLTELKKASILTRDSIKGTAYISTVSGKRFLNAFIKERMYIAEVKQEKNNLSILCLSDHFTAKYIKSSIELCKAIAVYYKTSLVTSYDDYFVLKNLQKVN